MDDIKDADGNVLSVGDEVHLIKDLKVKGMGKGLNRGDKFRIKDLTLDGDTSVEIKVGKSVIAIKQAFLKKA